MGTQRDAERAQRFTAEAGPVFDALGRRARRLTNNDADAEDLVQDTLLHAYRGFDTFEDGTNLTAWLFRILHNRWVSRHRYRVRRPAEVSLDAITDGLGHVPTAVRSAEVEVLELVPDGEVRSALAALAGPVRTAMYYVGVEGYTYAEAAALMDVPIGTVMSRVSRGRQRLRSVLSHLHHGESVEYAEKRSA